jgi:hypothetical protein
MRVKRNGNQALVGAGRPPPALCRRYSRIDIHVSADHRSGCIPRRSMDDGPKNPLRVKFNLRRDFNVIWVVQTLRQKYFAGPVGQISATSSPRPFPA